LFRQHRQQPSEFGNAGPVPEHAHQGQGRNHATPTRCAAQQAQEDRGHNNQCDQAHGPDDACLLEPDEKLRESGKIQLHVAEDLDKRTHQTDRNPHANQHGHGQQQQRIGQRRLDRPPDLAPRALTVDQLDQRLAHAARAQGRLHQGAHVARIASLTRTQNLVQRATGLDLRCQPR